MRGYTLRRRAPFHYMKDFVPFPPCDSLFLRLQRQLRLALDRYEWVGRQAYLELSLRAEA